MRLVREPGATWERVAASLPHTNHGCDRRYRELVARDGLAAAGLPPPLRASRAAAPTADADAQSAEPATPATPVPPAHAAGTPRAHWQAAGGAGGSLGARMGLAAHPAQPA